MRFSVLRLVILVLISFGFGCGSGDSDDDTGARILDLVLEDATISRGGKTRLDVNFTFANERVFDEDDNVLIAVKLPKGVRYVTNSGRVDSIGEDDDVDPIRFPCGTDEGELLVFDLDEQDLTGAVDPDGEADAKLRMDIEPLLSAPLGTNTIEARAGYNLTFASCDATFFGEEIELLTVLP